MGFQKEYKRQANEQLSAWMKANMKENDKNRKEFEKKETEMIDLRADELGAVQDEDFNKSNVEYADIQKYKETEKQALLKKLGKEGDELTKKAGQLEKEQARGKTTKK